MSLEQRKITSWKDSVYYIFHPRVITMFFFGISAGIPLLMIFSSLSLWLREAGVERAAVTFFSWAALGYSFKFVWAPVVDVLPVYFLSKKFGRRRGWILLSQIMVISSICGMAFTDPSKGESYVYLMGFAALCLGFSSATQDIVIDAYRIESADNYLQAMMASSYIAGYRTGMLVSGAGALFAAEFLGSSIAKYSYSAWQITYLIMAGFMLTGVVTSLVIAEPKLDRNLDFKYSPLNYLGIFMSFLICVSVFILIFYFSNYPLLYIRGILDSFFGKGLFLSFFSEVLRFVSALSGAFFCSLILKKTRLVNSEMMDETYIEPVMDFFSRYGLKLSVLLLCLIGVYRISDIVLGVISNLFYQDLGFSKSEIASVVKTFGLFMTIAGGFIGGIFSARFGVIKILFVGAFLSAVTNLLFMVMAYTGHDIFMLYLVISADNLAAGIATAAFVAFLSGLTNVRFTAVQYAVFSSLMTLVPKVFGGYSGTIVDNLGYNNFFLISFLMGLPVLFLVLLAEKYLKIND
ncbi:MAG: MFS transporter [Deltaproteobacteria bacterium]|nr:MAG: MFS transporter [Deltaproteobacteria bacterium]